MVRFATEADRSALVETMKASDAGCRDYSFNDMDGCCVVDEVDGKLRGLILFSLARPYTMIREIAILPEHRKGTVLAGLSAAVMAAAKQHGSQGVEGFKAGSNPAWIEFSRKRGAIVHAGARVRWLIDAPAVSRLIERRKRNA